MDFYARDASFPGFTLGFATHSEAHTLDSLTFALQSLPTPKANHQPGWRTGLVLRPLLSLGRAILKWIQRDTPQGNGFLSFLETGS